MNCNLIEAKLTHTVSVYYCPDCGWSGQMPPGLKPTRGCIKKRAPCVYRGEEARRVLCQSCGGHVSLRVYQCALHGECSLSTQAGVKSCQSCKDHVSVQ